MLFDALGTLVALEPPAPRLRRALAARTGIEVSVAQAERAMAAEFAYYRAHLNTGRDEVSLSRLRRQCADVLRAALPGPARDAALDAVLEALLDSLRFRAFEDARRALVAARSLPARVVVVSNWDISLERVLDQLGLAPRLDGVITSASVGSRKPSREIFARALELAGARPERAMHVGDTVEEDVVGARSAGITPVLLRRDGGSGPRGVMTIGSLAELPWLSVSQG